MVVSVSNIPVSVSTLVPGAARTSPKKSGDESLAGLGDIAPAAFASLLDATRTIIAAERVGVGKASPSQMFEPNAADSHKRREMALKAEDRSGDAHSGVTERLDRTSVESRKALGSRQVPNTAGAQAGDAHAVQKDGASDVPGESSGGFSPADGSKGADSTVASRPAMRSGDMLASPRGPQSVPAQDGGPVTPRDGNSGTAAQGAAGTDRTCVGTAAEVAGSSAAKPQTPAQQVAQVLAAGRVGESDGARVNTLPSAGADARQTRTDQKAAGRGGTPRQADTETSPRQTEGTSGKAGGVTRSAFDELVRSIRLQSGARWSSATLHLEPPRLGRLRVEVKLTGRGLNIDVHTETSAARHLVAERAAELRATLEQHGVHVDRLDVVLETPQPTPDDPSLDNGAGGSLTANRERRESSGVSSSAEGGGSSDWTEASAIPDVEVCETVVSEMRLDIRV